MLAPLAVCGRSSIAFCAWLTCHCGVSGASLAGGFALGGADLWFWGFFSYLRWMSGFGNSPGAWPVCLTCVLDGCTISASYESIKTTETNTFFFSSSVADVALMARSLHESKQLKLCTRTQSPWNQKIDWTKTTKTTTTQKATTCKSPSQTCVSPAETTKQTAEEHQNPNKKRGQGPNKNTHRIDLHTEAVENPLHPNQKHAIKRII